MPKLKMRRLHGLARNQQSVLLCALVYIYFKSKEYSYGFSVPLLYINQVAQQKQHLILIISKSPYKLFLKTQSCGSFQFMDERMKTLRQSPG